MPPFALTQSLLQAGVPHPQQTSSPMSGIDLAGMAKILMAYAPPSGGYSAEGLYNQLGGKPGGYENIDDLLGSAGRNPAPTLRGLFGLRP